MSLTSASSCLRAPASSSGSEGSSFAATEATSGRPEAAAGVAGGWAAPAADGWRSPALRRLRGAVRDFEICSSCATLEATSAGWAASLAADDKATAGCAAVDETSGRSEVVAVGGAGGRAAAGVEGRALLEQFLVSASVATSAPGTSAASFSCPGAASEYEASEEEAGECP